MDTKIKQQKRDRRRKRIRAKVFGTKDKPRLAVFKSNKYISAQLIDDSNANTIATAHSRNMKGKNMREKAEEVGLSLGESAKAKKVSNAVFDRGGYI